jgi:hypothetical protein
MTCNLAVDKRGHVAVLDLRPCLLPRWHFNFSLAVFSMPSSRSRLPLLAQLRPPAHLAAAGLPTPKASTASLAALVAARWPPALRQVMRAQPRPTRSCSRRARCLRPVSSRALAREGNQRACTRQRPHTPSPTRDLLPNALLPLGMSARPLPLSQARVFGRELNDAPVLVSASSFFLSPALIVRFHSASIP